MRQYFHFISQMFQYFYYIYIRLVLNILLILYLIIFNKHNVVRLIKKQFEQSAHTITFAGAVYVYYSKCDRVWRLLHCPNDCMNILQQFSKQRKNCVRFEVFKYTWTYALQYSIYYVQTTVVLIYILLKTVRYLHQEYVILRYKLPLLVARGSFRCFIKIIRPSVALLFKTRTKRLFSFESR